MSWPPGWSLVDDGSPSTTSGASWARAAYTAAVSPAGPEPAMRTVRRSGTAPPQARDGRSTTPLERWDHAHSPAAQNTNPSTA